MRFQSERLIRTVRSGCSAMPYHFAALRPTRQLLRTSPNLAESPAPSPYWRIWPFASLPNKSWPTHACAPIIHMDGRFAVSRRKKELLGCRGTVERFPAGLHFDRLPAVRFLSALSDADVYVL